MRKLLAVFISLGMCQSVFSQNAAITSQEIPDHIPGSVVVTLSENAISGAPSSAAGNSQNSEASNWLKSKKKLLGVSALNSLPANASANGQGPELTKNKLERTYVLDIPLSHDIDAAISQLSALAEVEYVEPVHVYNTTYVPSDPYYSYQWEHQLTNIEAAWDVQLGSSDVVVAVIDTGVDYSHEDLSVNIWRDADGAPGRDFVDINLDAYAEAGYSFIPEEDYTVQDNDPMDYDGHGTHVSGIVAASNNNVGMVGVAPGASIMPLRAGYSIIYDDRVVGSLNSVAIAEAIIYAADNGAQVINMSFGGRESAVIRNAVEYAYQQGVVLIASAGNDNSSSTTDSFPAAFPEVISVSALSHSGERASYSTYGSWVDIAAPGGDRNSGLISTVPAEGTLSSSSGYRSLQGTSMASPYVAGAVALLLSENPGLTPGEVKNALLESSDEIIDSSAEVYFGRGTLNLASLINFSSFVETTSSFSSPLAGSEIHGYANIEGTSDGDYTLEIGSGFYPDSWQVFASGSATTGLLGQLNTTEFEDGIYSIRLNTNLTGGYDTAVIDVSINSESRVKPGWSSGNVYNSGVPELAPTIADIDGDGTKEIIAYTASRSSELMPGVSVRDYQGNDRPGFPVLQTEGGYSSNAVSPVVAELDSTSPGKEIAMVYNTFANLARVVVYGSNGATLQYREINAGNNFVRKLAAADFDGNGVSTLVVSAGNVLHVLDEQLNTTAMLDGDFSIVKALSIADINRDGELEILVLGSSSSSVYLNAFAYDGTLLWEHRPSYSARASILNDIVVGDLNNDGFLETIFVSVYQGNNLNVVSHDGTVFRNSGGEPATWPQKIQTIQSTSGLIGFSVADVNGDNYLEVVHTFSQTNANGEVEAGVIAWNASGEKSLEFLVPLSTGIDRSDINRGQPMIADVDGDNELEVLVIDRSNEYELLGMNFDGTYADGFPISLADQKPLSNNTIAISDLENDGITDVVIAGQTTIVFEFGAYFEENMGWPVFQNGPEKQGVAKSIGPVLLRNYENVYFRGSANSWAATQMELVSDHIWEVTAHFDGTNPAGDRFKFDIFGDWSLNFGDGNVDGVADQSGDDIFVPYAGTYRIQFNDETLEYTPELIYRRTLQNFDQVYLRGTFNSWAPGTMLLSYDNTWELNVTFESGGRFKFDVHGDWSHNYGDANADGIAGRGEADIYIPSAGRYTIWFNDETLAYTMQAQNPVYTSTYEQMYFRGTPNSWGTSQMELVRDYVWQIEADFSGTGNDRFKFDVYGDWSLNFGDNQPDGTADQGGQDIQVFSPGRYLIEFNDSTRSWSYTFLE